MRSLILVIFAGLYLRGASADGNDWVNPAFVLQKNGMPNAQSRIISFAKSTASKGPWTVSSGTTILPPNGDKRDYLSWAPYHWPNCNWCANGQAHIATGGNRTDPGAAGSDADPSAPDDTADDDGDGEEDNDGDQGGQNGEADDGDVSDDSSGEVLPLSMPSLLLDFRKKMRRVRSVVPSQPNVAAPTVSIDQPASKLFRRSPQDVPNPDVPTVTVTIIPGVESTTTQDNVADGSTGVQAARKTQNPKTSSKTTAKANTKTTHLAAATKTAGGSGSDCTSSPTKSLAPSATWTTCKYVVKDGHVNPDVRDITGVSNIADTTQSILYNAIASVLSGSQDYAKTAVQFIETFFLDSKDGMHPRVAYGQVIRGPGTQVGQYLGLIDFRGMVKLVNAVQVMRAAKTPAWTSALDTQMVDWATQYVKWMQSDPLGQKALSAPNNHGTFATNQLAAVNILVQNPSDATTALKSYFSNQFLDQIAASGEQPFEAVRTRPFHYRCFNLEAMITNAKLGDQLGLNFWTAKSKYGATIKDALDFVMAKGPGKEDITDIFPHVAAVAAAYGDPDGKYASYLRQNDERYQTNAYYFYDQPGALTNAPAAPKSKSEQAVFEMEQELEELAQSFEAANSTPTILSMPTATPTIPWKCPDAFAAATEVELDDGVFVTCDELKHFYGYAEDGIEGV